MLSSVAVWFRVVIIHQVYDPNLCGIGAFLCGSVLVVKKVLFEKQEDEG